jgi:ribosome-associated translation inhibitor RaiA
MLIAFLLSPLLAAIPSSAFVINRNGVSPPFALRMSTETGDVPLVLNGRNIALTPAISDYVEKKIGGPLRKLASTGNVRECDVHLSVNKNPKVRLQKRSNEGVQKQESEAVDYVLSVPELRRKS